MIRTIFAMITAVIMTLIIGSMVIVVGLFNPYSNAVNVLGRIWSRSLLFAAGVKIEIEGLHNIAPNTSYVVMGNHQSHYDVPAVFSIAKNLTLRFFTKKELFTIPLFGWAMRSAGMIKIDRSDREKAIDSMNLAIETIHKGVSLVVFPEGTRSTDGKVHQFKKGGFVIAIRGKIPILPISISGSRFILKKHTFKIEPGIIKIVFNRPIDTSKYIYAQKEELIEKTKQRIIESIDPEINDRVD